jgi:hypothetical protein
MQLLLRGVKSLRESARDSMFCIWSVCLRVGALGFACQA